MPKLAPDSRLHFAKIAVMIIPTTIPAYFAAPVYKTPLIKLFFKEPIVQPSFWR